jgi:subfamily B ATP-binding cassette protein MsbA
MISTPHFRVLARASRHAGLIWLVLLFTFLHAAVSGVSLGTILPFVDLLFSQGAPAAPEPVANAGVVDNLRHQIQLRAAEWFFHDDPRAALQRICTFLLIAFFLKGVVRFLLALYSVLLEERVLKGLRDDLFDHLQSLSMGWFAGHRSGDLLSRATNDVAVVRKMISSVFRSLPRDVLLVVVYLAIVFIASWRLALLCFAVLPVLAFVISSLGKRIRRHSGRAQNQMADLSSIFQETISGMRVVKAFGAQAFVFGRFLERSRAYLKSIVRLRRIASLAAPIAEMMGAVGAVAILWAGGNEVLSGTGLTATWFVIFLAAMMSLMQPVRGLSQLHTHLEEGGAAAARIFEILDTEPNVKDRPDAITVQKLERDIVFDAVSFEYDVEAPVIHDVNLTIARGEVIALVGPSGAGKSTLADLIPRFHDPDRGRILLDGRDLRDITQHSLRGLVGNVTQDTILFHDTITANIAYADSDPDPARVEAAARAANAHEFALQTPHGYDTVLGERGMRLSGGERQRIAIARAIYRDPQILIFDEATSSLDSESEAKVQEAIDRLMVGRTAIVIAHRLSTVRNADRIVVMDGGRIVEQGTHDELFKRNGLYARLCQRQLAGSWAASTRVA